MKLFAYIPIIFCVTFCSYGQDKTQISQTTTIYAFHYATTDEFQQTVPVEGGKGKALYNVDNVGAYIDGEFELNLDKKYFILRFTGDKKESAKAIIDSGPEYDKFWDSYTYNAHWEQKKNKTRIVIAYNNSMRMITLSVGYNQGQYADYWERIFHYHVKKKN